MKLRLLWKRRYFIWLVRIKPFFYWLTHNRCIRCGEKKLRKYHKICYTCGILNIAEGIFDEESERDVFLNQIFR